MVILCVCVCASSFFGLADFSAGFIVPQTADEDASIALNQRNMPKTHDTMTRENNKDIAFIFHVTSDTVSQFLQAASASTKKANRTSPVF